MFKLLSDRVKKVPSTEVSSDRYDYIQLSEVEPDLGVPVSNNALVSSTTEGVRRWLYPSTGLSVDINGIIRVDENTIVIDTTNFNFSNSANLADVLFDLDQNISSATSGTLTSVVTDSTLTGAGTSASPLSVNASSSNVGNTIVIRDADGNFSAEVITATTIQGNLDWSYLQNIPPTSPSVITAVAPPDSPSGGDLWWDSVNGILKIYYIDVDSAQWVDASTSRGTITTSGSGSAEITEAGIIAALGYVPADAAVLGDLQAALDSINGV